MFPCQSGFLKPHSRRLCVRVCRSVRAVAAARFSFLSLFFFFFFNLRARAHNHAHFTLHKHAAAIRRCPDWEHRLVLVCFRSHHKICPICLLSLSFFFLFFLGLGARRIVGHTTQELGQDRAQRWHRRVWPGALHTHTHWITSVTLKHHHAPRFRMAIEGW